MNIENLIKPIKERLKSINKHIRYEIYLKNEEYKVKIFVKIEGDTLEEINGLNETVNKILEKEYKVSKSFFEIYRNNCYLVYVIKK